MASPSSGLGVRPSSGARLPGIEGLRAFAACSVLVFHTWGWSPSAQSAQLWRFERFMPDLTFGVILFFTLSGFLLYRPFAAAGVRGTPRPSIGRYFRNRALRILPAYWVILLACAAIGAALFWDSSGRLVTGRMLDPALLARAAFFLQTYSPDTILNGIGPAWSLAVEVVFYCTLPLLVLLAARLGRRCATRAGRRWAALTPALLLLAVGLSGKFAAGHLVPPPTAYGGFGQNWHSALQGSFWCQADLFACGIVVAVLRVDWEDGLLRLPSWWRPAAAAVAIGIYLVTTATWERAQLSYSVSNTLISGAFALLLALVVLQPSATTPTRLVRFLELRALVAAGVVSYSIFLWHEPLVRWLNKHEVLVSGTGGFFANLLLVGLITGVLSACTYRFVEAPALRLKFRAGRTERAPVPASQVEAAP